MLKRERQEILSWAAGISDKKLEEEYYSVAYACLGSAAEEMYECGYAEEDIREREKYEKYLGEKADILESLCMSRGINYGKDVGRMKIHEILFRGRRPICKECPFQKQYRRHFNSTREVMCEHPDKEYIRKYFEEHGIRKYEGFIGFVNSKGVFPIKKSPAWCPLKQKGGVQ